MARELALGLVIGGAVSKSVGAAFKDVEGRVKRLESTAGKAKVLQSVIGETKRLQEEWRKAHSSGSAMADGLRRKLDANLESLKRQGVEVKNLSKAYQQAGRQARSAELKSTGQAQMKEGGAGLRSTALATSAAAATMIVPTKVSAEFGAVIRDIAIKAGVAGKDEEKEMANTIIGTSRDTGLARNEVAETVNALVGAGMELKQAMAYAPVAAKFVVGQGAGGADTAAMINALGQNAKITDPKDMQKALEAIAFQGQAGSFEAADMARWFPTLLAGMGKLGITGNDAVAQLGAMLQVQMKTAGSSDEAANNLKNWMEKIGSGDVVKAYKDAGIDYQKSMRGGMQNGMSTLEASFGLAQKYVEATDPKKAAEMAKAMSKISKEADPTKAKAMMNAFEESMRTGDLFADMQVKAALTAYMQNKALYQKLKKDSGNASGILDKNLDERRDGSAQKWKETGQAMDDALRSAGDAIRPLTDTLSTGLTAIAKGVAAVSDKSPALVTGLLGAGAAIAGISAAYNSFKIVKGVMNIGRGSMMGNPNVVQKVAVVSGLGGLGGGGPDLGGGSGKTKTKVKRGWRRRGVGVSAPAASDSAAKPRMRVYAGGGPAEASKSLSGWKPPTSVPKASVPAVASMVPSSSSLGVLRGIGKSSIPAALFDGLIDAKDVYDNAKTKDEKAEGYGEAGGGVVGTLAGAAAGAAIGSVVPIIGTAIGAMIGGALGSMGGKSLGGAVSKSLFGGPEAVASNTAPITPLLMKDRTGPAVPSLASMGSSFGPKGPLVTRNASSAMPGLADVSSALKAADTKTPVATLAAAAKAVPEKPAAPKIDQKITLSPTFTITVQGDAKNPAALLNQMMPEIERRLATTAQQVARRDMSDQLVF
ncbi:phage tail tape measure protein [Pseudomonas quasicaspiana]|nr:phage tail tape measure protein [Pseudomonas quasicaspiana]